MKQKYSVNIAGSSMTVVTEEDEEYVKGIAGILDRRINDLMINRNKCSKMEALMLCALDYLDATVKLKAEVEDLKEQLNDRKKA